MGFANLRTIKCRGHRAQGCPDNVTFEQTHPLQRACPKCRARSSEQQARHRAIVAADNRKARIQAGLIDMETSGIMGAEKVHRAMMRATD